jgi:chaperonin GroEL
MAKTPVFNLDKVIDGLNITVKAASGTLGPKGRNVLYPYPPHYKVTNDGKTIVDAIDLEDEAEKQGSWMVKNTCAQQVDDAGDGSTTVAVLLQAITEEARKRPENATEVSQSLKSALPNVLKAIKAKSKPVKDILQVALISAEDKILAQNIAEVVAKVGAEGTILVEENNEPKIDYEIVNGYEANVGYMSPYFATDTKKMVAEMKDVAVFCTRRKINAVGDLQPLIEQMNTKNIKQVVIVTEDIDPQMLGILVTSRLQGKISCVVVKATGALLDDIAMATGASLLCDDTGVTFENFQADEHFGKCQKFTCGEKKSVFISNAKTAKEQAKRLETMAEKNPNTFEAKKYRERAAKLKSGIAVLRIGSPTTVDMGYLKDKADDAVHATQAALEEGVVAGGGVCLRDIAYALKPKSIGEEILKKALVKPYKQILENGGQEYAEHAYDIYPDSVIDPAKVTRCAVTNATINAALLISTHCAVVEVVKETKHEG